ncbi:MAG: hypothetical protein F6J94_02450 [Moorea sp. SIO1F2]|uniref:hypothetical protein n=1 Tax=unclassified Moorena TaxID=2683338 RepID=UPI0013B8AA08|nr:MULTISPECIES: hypothetical protein [unclassified Moorena]NEP22183.1 hypothetical protein [Moorena sp. SIO3I6]NET80875.1 hypothetical protein [Moorena sp. SIO1F2]
MPIPRPDAHATARCPCHGQMPMPRPDAHSTGATVGELNSPRVAPPGTGKMPIPQNS